ncbi:MAG: serine/threonine protein kinase [Alphaproteobacteria bacterium]|nr:serine/threonine protein kinase [Alphaproteobacteria bacterium]
MELATGATVDRYVVEGVLGEGGMAIVYLCRHVQLGTKHALKLLTMSSRAIKERLVQEGQVQASLRHPNIVAVTDIIVVNGAPGLVMEYIEGPSLDDLLDQQTLTYEQADVLVEGLLRGVAHAHSRGLVHRDLKPANIMLAVEGEQLVPKVMDFGLAKLVEGDDSRTRTGSTMGTPSTCRPSRWRTRRTSTTAPTCSRAAPSSTRWSRAIGPSAATASTRSSARSRRGSTGIPSRSVRISPSAWWTPSWARSRPIGRSASSPSTSCSRSGRARPSVRARSQRPHPRVRSRRTS